LEDLRNLVGGDRRKFHDWCVEHVPGYGGYAEKETRREADKLLRKYIAEKLGEFRRRFVKIAETLTNAGRLEELVPVDRLSAKMEKIEDRIRFADYGYSGFFDPVRVDEHRLDKIYEFDAEILSQALETEELVSTAQKSTDDAQKLSKAIETLTAKIEGLDAEFGKREEILLQP